MLSDETKKSCNDVNSEAAGGDGIGYGASNQYRKRIIGMALVYCR